MPLSTLWSSSRGRPGRLGLCATCGPLPQAIVDLPRPSCARLRLGCLTPPGISTKADSSCLHPSSASTVKRGFGRRALPCEGKIFAMLVRDRLVVKLPARRVDELAAQREAARFDANKGTPMKEWFSLDADSGLAWSALAREALGYARARH